MRAVTRIAGRANLPLRYSQGFNPRPVLSLPCPRPVGIATRDDRLVLALDRGVEPDALVRRLNEQAPEGMRFRDAQPLPAGRSSLPPVRVAYELLLPEETAQALKPRLDELATLPSWPVPRAGKPAGHRSKRPTKSRTIDLRPRVANLELRDGRLCFVCVPHEQSWARPGEVLRLLGLDDSALLAQVVRTEMDTDAEGVEK